MKNTYTPSDSSCLQINVEVFFYEYYLLIPCLVCQLTFFELCLYCPIYSQGSQSLFLNWVTYWHVVNLQIGGTFLYFLNHENFEF